FSFANPSFEMLNKVDISSVFRSLNEDINKSIDGIQSNNDLTNNTKINGNSISNRFPNFLFYTSINLIV
ncbi:MAG TPA: hypothetical protein VN703_02395, partial [Candidatus Sulfopaludibacter sp.]|nr:hypothetical protein [Candidatus Sulfopaludibacter sp.]